MFQAVSGDQFGVLVGRGKVALQVYTVGADVDFVGVDSLGNKPVFRGMADANDAVCPVVEKTLKFCEEVDDDSRLDRPHGGDGRGP